jgi:DNA helicase HerA-like ATPase
MLGFIINPMSLEPVPIGIQHDPGALYQQSELVIPSEARRKHMAIFGTTGAGKSTLMRNMIAADIASGIGCTVVDPHGQLVEDILNNHIPRYRTDDVIYFNPKDPARTIPLNLLDSPDHELDGVVVDNAISIFKQLWPAAFGVGARMEDIFRNSF